MAKFNLDNYETVEDRLKVFWKDNPNGRIWTEVVHETEDGSCVTIRALIYINADDSNPISTGIAQETKGQGGFANTDAWVENCETSAIGRALANWKYQGTGKARPSQQEMSKVGNSKDNVGKKETPKKKPVAQEITKSPSSLTEPQLKEMVFSMCNEDKDFAKKCYQTSMTRFKMDKSISDNVGDWSNDNVDKFLKLVEDYVDKFKNEFEKRAGNTEVVNNIIETLGNVKEKESEENMTDIPSGPWEQDPPTDRQLNTFNDKVAQATDNGQTELVKKAKDFLASGKATKGNIFDWIDTEGDWTLKDGS